MTLRNPFRRFIDEQYRCPSGPVGRVLGVRMVRQHEPETRWTLELLAVQPADHVLDIGCGAGRAVECAADLATRGQVTGIDLSSTMVQAARRRNVAKVRTGQVRLLQGNMHALPFAEEQFEKILTVQTFYFWSDLSRALAEITRVLKPAGTFVLTLSTGTIGSDGKKEIWPFQTALEEQVIPGLKRCGFTHAELKEGPASRQFITVAVVGRK